DRRAAAHAHLRVAQHARAAVRAQTVEPALLERDRGAAVRAAQRAVLERSAARAAVQRHGVGGARTIHASLIGREPDPTDRRSPKLARMLSSAVRMGVLCVLVAARAHAQSQPAAPATPAPPRSVLFVTLDTLRADALGCYGGPDWATPALDALARD